MNRLHLLSASGGGIVMVGIGLHYNNAEPIRHGEAIEFSEEVWYGPQVHT